MKYPNTPRNLTQDERKAAEAAFQGRPFNSQWSQAARIVYDGILSASGDLTSPANPNPLPLATDTSAPDKTSSSPSIETRKASLEASSLTASSQDGQTESLNDAHQSETAQPVIRSREEALQTGLLIDVTPLAKTIGLPLPVGITKPLWDVAITASHGIPEDQYESRMRDVLMALRLRLSTSRTTIPWIEFPVLLAFPPDTIPHLCVLHAIAHGDQATTYALTLSLRDEVSTIISPLNN